jgi:2-dehydropantoate 2-reductase
MELASSDMVVRRYEDPDRMKWSKALTNIVSNASSAILGWNPAQIFQHPGLYRIEVEALREAVQVMMKMGTRPQNLPGVPLSLLGYGIFLPPRLIQRVLGRIVARGRGDKRPSFHFDIGRGRSEVKWLNGAIASAGDTLDVPTPANRVLFETMMSLVDRSVEHEKFLGKPNELLGLAARAGVPGIQGYNPSRE